MGDLRSELGKQARTRLLDAGLKKTGLDHVIIIIKKKAKITEFISGL